MVTVWILFCFQNKQQNFSYALLNCLMFLWWYDMVLGFLSKLLFDIWGSHGGEDDVVLDFDAF
jgi:hypothetical protein